MAYNSAYKGSEIDAAVGAVKNKEAIWDNKQDELTGTEDQIVGFNSAGEAVAVAPPDMGVTTFNGRTGAVTPQNGDYTAEMVGARPSTWTPSAADVGAVPTTRTVNGQALSADISLTASDVGARASTWTPTASDVGAVPTSRTVNGKALSSNITLTADDVNAASPPSSTTITLTTSGWSSNTQTVTVQGVLADETKQLIQPMPAIASQIAYMSAGIYCSGQAANSLTFTCSETPTEDIALYIVITEVGA